MCSFCKDEGIDTLNDIYIHTHTLKQSETFSSFGLGRHSWVCMKHFGKMMQTHYEYYTGLIQK